MATDATGTPTSPDGIPKYNTALDAPSGKGLNAIVDFIQTLLNGVAKKPSGIVSGEVPVWNGTTWVRSSATNVGATSLGSGTPDTTKFLRGDGSWQPPPAFTPVTYRKVTAVAVTNTVANTDLFGGAITIGAGALSATGIMRIRAWGTCGNATGAAQNSLRFQLMFGATMLWDTGASTVTTIGTGGGAIPWEWDIILNAVNATNSQIVFGKMQHHHITSNTTAWLPTTGAGLTIAAVENAGGHAFTHTEIRGTAAKDMTVANALILNIINPVASVNFTTTLDGALVEIV